jgi:hypothetical protein
MSLPAGARTGTVTTSGEIDALMRTPTEATMNGQCGCGHEAPGANALFGCFECGTTCCRACTIHLESATYCRACAGSLLDTAAVHSADPFELH